MLAKVLQPLVVALSIMAAGLLVRLNRGMPTLDWKGLDPSERKVLTGKIVGLTREYMLVLSLQVSALVALLVLAVNDHAELTAMMEKVVVGVVGALVGLAAARMAYIVWRDYDIVRLQRKLIDDAADRDARSAASQEASARVAAIRAAALRPAQGE